MAQARLSQLTMQTTASALREKSKLRRHFRRFDMLFYALGRPARAEVATEPVVPAVAADPGPVP